MQSILSKLTADEIKELSKALNEVQAKSFGNPLSLRKQEQLMADLFKVKDWSTLLGLAKTAKTYDPEGNYQRTVIEVELLTAGPFPTEYNLNDIHEDITFGACSGRYREVVRENLTEKEMEEALIKQGTDPDFLILTYQKPSEELQRKKNEIYYHICDFIFEENEPLWMDGKVEDVAQEFFKIFRRERDAAIKKRNAMINDHELETLNRYEKIFIEDKTDFTEAEVINKLRKESAN